MIYSLCLVLVLVGVYGVLTQHNALKIVISLLVIEHGLHLFLVLEGYRAGGVPPVRERGMDAAAWAAQAVDPFPQAMVLTSIVIGLGTLALLVALCIRLRERLGTLDVTRMDRLKG